MNEGMPAKQADAKRRNGASVMLNSLPPSNTKRWVVRRKAAVVQAVRSGLISLDDACRRYSLSVEEFLSWERAMDKHGLRGLRITRLQDYRAPERPPE